MTRITPAALLLAVSLAAIGCNTTQQPQTAQRGSDVPRSAGDDQYNRSYQSESSRHHHRKHGEAATEDSSTYERPDADILPDESPRGSGTRRQSSSKQHHNSKAVTATPGQFDFYLLNLSWSPEFCHGHPNAAECAQHRAFTLHGLWPQNNDGTYPEDCSDATGPASPSQYADIYPDAGLLQHEWQTHGTCSGLTPDQFLTLARRAQQSVRIPAELSHPSGQQALAPDQLITLFKQANPALPASSIAISCGNNYLTAVEVCMDKNLKPQSCTAIRTCGANQIRIPAPQ